MTIDDCHDLQDLPNVGPATARDFRRIGITQPDQLRGRDPYSLYQELCRVTGVQQDPCILDVFISTVRFAEGAPAKPWWRYTAERKRIYRSGPPARRGRSK